MKNLMVTVPAPKKAIYDSPGFAKKGPEAFPLATHHMELMGLCGYGCRYCSSNSGNYLRMNREAFKVATKEQTGLDVLPSEEPLLSFAWNGVVERLEAQLSGRRQGEGKVLVLSQLTDAFSPWAVESGLTRKVFDILVEKTDYTIRVLTKNACVGSEEWIRVFEKVSSRICVGLSTGTTNAKWAKKVETNTSPPAARIRAHQRLIERNIPTYAMMCPVFPDMVRSELDNLIDELNPRACFEVYVEPYNDRDNWRHVRDGYESDDWAYWWLTDVFEQGNKFLWSEYATNLYCKVYDRAKREGWADKIRYLLYELDIAEKHVSQFIDRNMEGVYLQSKAKDGYSKNATFRRYGY